jgi:DNA-binding IclR family transcriptional regulator
VLKTLDNSLTILEYFTKECPAWGLRELAKELEINHTIVYRILTTFVSHGFLTQDPITKKYQLGLKLLEYGSIIRANSGISDIIYPIMKDLSEETGETIFLTWLDKYEGICLEVVESAQRIKFQLSVGSRTPLYLGASNKVMMAFLPRESQELIIAKGMKPKTAVVPSKEKLLGDLQRIKQEGWAFSTGEYTELTFGLAVPLFDSHGQVIASLTVSGPEYRMPVANVDNALLKLLAGRNKIQDLLHQHGGSYAFS